LEVVITLLKTPDFETSLESLQVLDAAIAGAPDHWIAEQVYWESFRAPISVLLAFIDLKTPQHMVYAVRSLMHWLEICSVAQKNAVAGKVSPKLEEFLSMVDVDEVCYCFSRCWCCGTPLC